jgi:hypothetical protein
MIDLLMTCWYWYKFTWLISLVLLPFRDDKTTIISEMKRSIAFNRVLGIIHIVLVIVVLPISLPFTLTNIINRWL